jgi:flagellar protein FlaF
MSNSAAQAYARTTLASAAANPREIEAQALLKAARQLQEVQTNWDGPDMQMQKALMFNRQLWTIFMSAAESNDNPQPLEIRQNIANLAAFVMKQTIEMQLSPDPAKLKSLIDINCNIAAGLAGRG